MTKNRKEYLKQLKRLKALKRRAESRGYIVADDVIPDKPPKIVTKKRIEELRKITGETFYYKAGVEYIMPETGEIVKGSEGKKFENTLRNINKYSDENFIKKRKKYIEEYAIDIYDRAEPRAAIEAIDIARTENKEQDRLGELMFDNFMYEMSHYPANLFKIVEKYFNRLLEKHTKGKLGRALQDMPYNIKYYLTSGLYGSEQAIREFSSEIVNYLPMITDKEKQEMFDAFVEVENVAEEGI